jgi:hypothetical protein
MRLQTHGGARACRMQRYTAAGCVVKVAGPCRDYEGCWAMPRLVCRLHCVLKLCARLLMLNQATANMKAASKLKQRMVALLFDQCVVCKSYLLPAVLACGIHCSHAAPQAGNH